MRDILWPGLAADMHAADIVEFRHDQTEIASDWLLENEVRDNAHVALRFQATKRLVHFRKSLQSGA
jgi:hypothetical protein